MPVCSYLVFPRRGRSTHAAAALSAIPGCDVSPADDRELLVLVTSSADAASEESLRAAVEAVEDVECLALSFGEIPSGSSPTVDAVATPASGGCAALPAAGPRRSRAS